VLVGPEAKSFKIHKALLVSKSDYFRKALSHGWKEATEGIFTLVEENTAIFGLFLAWLYSSKLHYVQEEDSLRLLVEACIFADRRGCPEFHNAVMDEIHRYLPEKVGSELFDV